MCCLFAVRFLVIVCLSLELEMWWWWRVLHGDPPEAKRIRATCYFVACNRADPLRTCSRRVLRWAADRRRREGGWRAETHRPRQPQRQASHHKFRGVAFVNTKPPHGTRMAPSVLWTSARRGRKPTPPLTDSEFPQLRINRTRSFPNSNAWPDG